MDSQLYEIRDVPGKGKGLVARVQISVGTRILLEKPLLSVPPIPNLDAEAFIESLLADLPEKEKQDFLSLQNNYPEMSPCRGIFKTNALPCGPDDTVHSAVYQTMCLINHSCAPNCQHTWNDDRGGEALHAVRPVEAGEEITISYDDGDPSHSRWAFLKACFGFDCRCDICSLPPDELQESDDRRSKLRRIQQRFDILKGDIETSRARLNDCYVMLSVLEKEWRGAAQATSAVVLHDAFSICVAHGDQARASVFAKRAYQARAICAGEDSPFAKNLKALADRPSDHQYFQLFSTEWKRRKSKLPKNLSTEEFEKWLFRM